MTPRPTRAEQEAAAARRLRLLGDELAAVRGEPPPGPGPEPVPVVPTPGRHASRRRSTVPRWVPEPLRGRVALGPGPVAVVAVLVAAGLAVTTWVVVRADSRPVVPVAPPRATPSALAQAAPSTAEAGVEQVTVDVAGKVRRPGIAVLEPGARVVDAIRAAGGARRGVDLTGLNLARVLVDGEQVVVGPAAPAAPALPSSPGAPTGTLVNINTATQAELESLPEVGPVTAMAILGWREEHGGFTSISELLEVDGIGEATLETLTPFVTV